jgi:integrase
MNPSHPYDLVIGLDRADKKACLCLIDIRTVQELLGRANVETTMTYTHVLNHPGVTPVKSPLDAV